MNKTEFTPLNRQERKQENEILKENLISANRLILDLQKFNEEILKENVQQDKRITYLQIAIVVVIFVELIISRFF